MPATLAPYPARTLLDDLADTARDDPGRPGLLFKGRTVTYGELNRLTDACASESRLLVPGHDPAVFERFPRVSDRIVRIQ